MAAYTAADVKDLREKTGACMLDCKNALGESEGDVEKAIELLRIKGQKGVAKREDRDASNGLVAVHTDGGLGVMVQLNCETDFVAKSEGFIALSQQVLDQAVAVAATDAESLLASDLGGRTVQQLLDEANATMGEKILVPRVARIEGTHVSAYLHRTATDLPPTIGVLVALDAVNDEIGKDVAMHTAAMSPTYLTREDVPAEKVESERRIAEETAREENKPEAAMAKIVEGRVNSYFKDNVLLEQPFAKDPKTTITKLLAGAGVHVTSFARFRAGASTAPPRRRGRGGGTSGPPTPSARPDQSRLTERDLDLPPGADCPGPPPHPIPRSPRVSEPSLTVDLEAGTVRPSPAYRRVLLKLSGEFFGNGRVGVDPDVISQVAREIAGPVKQGVQVAIVVGGGNFFRGAELSQRGMERSRADYMGMLGTVMNALALQDFLEQQDVSTRVQTAITMGQVAEPYIPRRAIRHMEKGRVVIFGAGAGMPYFSTDTVAAQRALEVRADAVLMAKNGVDGVYTGDPRKDPAATKIDTISYAEALQRNLRVVDTTAFSLCMDNRLPMIVFGMEGQGVARALRGERIGTQVIAD